MPVRKDYQVPPSVTLNVKASDTVDTPTDTIAEAAAVTAELPRTVVPSFDVSDEPHRRALAQHLSKVYYLQSHIVHEVNSRYMQATDLVGVANLLTIFYQACAREYENKTDFKAKGAAGYGHSLTTTEVSNIARALILMFGPEFLFDADQKKAFFEALNTSAQDIADLLAPTAP